MQGSAVGNGRCVTSASEVVLTIILSSVAIFSQLKASLCYVVTVLKGSSAKIYIWTDNCLETSSANHFLSGEISTQPRLQTHALPQSTIWQVVPNGRSTRPGHGPSMFALGMSRLWVWWIFSERHDLAIHGTCADFGSHRIARGFLEDFNLDSLDPFGNYTMRHVSYHET